MWTDLLTELSISGAIAVALTCATMRSIRRGRKSQALALLCAFTFVSTCAAATLQANGPGAGLELSDQVVEFVLLPRLERAKTDPDYRKATVEQLRRVGGPTLAEVCFESILDDCPRLLWNPPAIAIIRQQLKLPKMEISEIRARRDQEKREQLE